MRDATRLLAEVYNTCVVDTSNEIAGDGDIPHDCVGMARRMMVPSLDAQAQVMIECVQNHTPDVIVIDEIGRPAEVEAARTCKQRGVRMVASAHGDLRSLMKNRQLRGLIGGLETVTLGDAAAKMEKGGSKLKSQRSAAPAFEVIVQLRKGEHHTWHVILDAAEAVDAVLESSVYDVQKRTRDPETGALEVEMERL